MKKNAFFSHFFTEKFGHIKKKQYLCTEFKDRANLIERILHNHDKI